VDISVYLYQSLLDKILPKLLLKVLLSGQRAVVLCPDATTLKDMDLSLWVFSKMDIIPHGSEEDGYADMQPVWLTLKLENLNQANVLVVLNNENIDLSQINNFDRVLFLQPLLSRNALHSKIQMHNPNWWEEQTTGEWRKSV
jgi:DNA polymerase III subunit chi